jgi:hypothetical protein
VIVTPTYVLAVGVDDECCIPDPMATDRTLCKRWRRFVPGVPELPVHEVCKREWRRVVRAQAAAVREAA